MTEELERALKRDEQAAHQSFSELVHIMGQMLHNIKRHRGFTYGQINNFADIAMECGGNWKTWATTIERTKPEAEA